MQRPCGECPLIKRSLSFIFIWAYIFLPDWTIILFSGDYQCHTVLNYKGPDNLNSTSGSKDSVNMEGSTKDLFSDSASKIHPFVAN